MSGIADAARQPMIVPAWAGKFVLPSLIGLFAAGGPAISTVMSNRSVQETLEKIEKKQEKIEERIATLERSDDARALRLASHDAQLQTMRLENYANTTKFGDKLGEQSVAIGRLETKVDSILAMIAQSPVGTHKP